MMWSYQLLVSTAVLLLVMPRVMRGVTAATSNVTIGFLVGRQLKLSISGALTYAVKAVNENDTLLPDHTLVVKYHDYADQLAGYRAITDLWKEGAVAFFGPGELCFVEANLAAAWDLPMISYRCSDSAVSDKKKFPTFVRTFPPDKQVTKSVIALLKYHLWFKFTILHEDSSRWQIVATELVTMAKANNMTINEKRAFVPPLKCCMEGLACCEPSGFINEVQESYLKTRVYVFLGEPNDLVKMMKVMENKELLINGDYIVIYVDLDYVDEHPQRFILESSEMNMDKEFTQTLVNGRSLIGRTLLVISPTSPFHDDPKFKDFDEKVRLFNTLPPFNFPISTILKDKGLTPFVPPFATFLYDSVILYAEALHEALLNKSKVTNGTVIINRIMDRTFHSISGVSIHVDEHGDAEGNFSVLAYGPQTTDDNATKGMYPVGIFLLSQRADKLPEFRLQGKRIDWIAGEKPPDEPPCGFTGEKCRPHPDTTREIATGVLGGLLVVVVASAIILYRNWKYEQEIAGLLWKLNIKEIETQNNYKMSANSKMSVTSQNSIESRMGGQVFIETTGRYKGTIVAIKHFEFKKKILDIPRETKIEMKLMKEIRHDNINPFIGSCLEPNQIYIVTEYCTKGSLLDILGNDNLKLEPMVISSLILDLIKGMTYLHNSDLKCHGNLKSSNCVVTSRWVLQVADFGLHELRRQAQHNENKEEYRVHFGKLWTAPEILRSPASYPKGTQKGDVYSFAIILYEIFGREGPYPESQVDNISLEEILENLKSPPEPGRIAFRPDVSILQCQEYIINCINDCWQEKPEARPDFGHIRQRLKAMRQGMKPNIFDHMMALMENYAQNLEELVNERTKQLVEEKKLTETLLHRMLPESVAAALMRGEVVKPEAFDAVTIYFSDIVGFTNMSAESTPMEVVTFLNELYTIFDNAISNYDVYKVETIGDAYMVVSGLPIRNGENHVGQIASMALDLLAAVKNFRIPHKPNETLKLRIGIHTGPVVAGVVGKTMPRYCLFGDTVNTASRMESNGEALKIHISQECKDALAKLGGYVVEQRGTLNIKGKGEMTTYWLEGHAEDFIGVTKKKDPREVLPLFVGGRIMSVDMGQPEPWKGYRGVGIPRAANQSTRSIQEFGDKSSRRTRNYSPVRQLSVYHSYVESDVESPSRTNTKNAEAVSEESGGSGDTIPADERLAPTVAESSTGPAPRNVQIVPPPSNHVGRKLLNNNNNVSERPRSVVIENSAAADVSRTVPSSGNDNQTPNANSTKSGDGGGCNGQIGGCNTTGVDLDSTADETTHLLNANGTEQLVGVSIVGKVSSEHSTNEEDEKGEPRKRWRSCSEINVPQPRPRPKTLKNWLTGLFNYRESLGSIPRGTLTGDGESVV